MITEKQEEKLIKRLTDRINKANEYFLKSIGSYIKEIKGLSPTKAQQLIQVLRYGGNYKDIIKQIEKSTDINAKDIETIFKEYAKKDAMFYEQFYQYRNKPFNNNLLDDELKALSRVSQKAIYDYTRPNVLGFTIRNPKNDVVEFLNLRETYNTVLEQALLNVSQGKETFDVSMRKILEDIGKSGLRKVEYESGRSYRLNSIVRMHLKDSLRDLHNRNVELYGEGFEADGYEISVHRYPAEDHEDIQGRQLYKEEYEKLQESGVAKDVKGIKRDIRTKYGFRPISAMNCYHYIFPIIVGVNKPEYTEEQLKAIKEENDKGFDFEGQHYSMYEGTQLQRSIERNIREQKDIQILARASGDEELAMSSQKKINLLSKKYKELSNVSGLQTEKDRMSVKGYRKIKVKEEVKPKVVDKNNIFISKEDQLRRLTFKKESIEEKLNDTKAKLDNIPKDSTRGWDVSMRKIYESDIKKYNKQINEINLENIEDKTIYLKDKDSCKELLKEVNITLEDKNLDLISDDVIIENTRHYYETITKYPFLEQSLQEDYLKFGFNDLPGGTIGQAERGGKRIELSIENYKNKDDLLYWGKYQTKDGYNMPCSEDNYINYFATHELGHTFNYRVLDNVEIKEFEDLSVREWSEKTNEYFLDNIYKIAEKNTGKSKEELLGLMSDYGKSTVEEGMAELFANANCGKPNALGQAFEEYFEELLK